MARLEIIHLHTKIENYFTNQLSISKEMAEQEFFNHFSTNFTIVGLDGNCRDFTWLRSWFPSTLGSKPDLKIKVDDFRNIYAGPELMIVGYKEVHTLENKIITRASTVIFVHSNEMSPGKLLWLRLHETLCSG